MAISEPIFLEELLAQFLLTGLRGGGTAAHTTFLILLL